MTDRNGTEENWSPVEKEKILLRAHVAHLGISGRKKIRGMLEHPEEWSGDPEEVFTGAEQFLTDLSDRGIRFSHRNIRNGRNGLRRCQIPRSGCLCEGVCRRSRCLPCQ